MASKRQRESAWDKAKPIPGKDPNLYRRDRLGNEIYKHSSGMQGPKSWEVDHSNPKSNGGTDSPRNLQAMQTRANRQKGDKYPYLEEPNGRDSVPGGTRTASEDLAGRRERDGDGLEPNPKIRRIAERMMEVSRPQERIDNPKIRRIAERMTGTKEAKQRRTSIRRRAPGLKDRGYMRLPKIRIVQK